MNCRQSVAVFEVFNVIQLYCLPLQSLTASDVDLIASSVEHHPSLKELTVEGECREFEKGAVEGMTRRHGVEKLVVIRCGDDSECF